MDSPAFLADESGLKPTENREGGATGEGEGKPGTNLRVDTLRHVRTPSHGGTDSGRDTAHSLAAFVREVKDKTIAKGRKNGKKRRRKRRKKK